jgi:hypothetical protein
MKDCIKHGNHLGIFFVLLFILCFFWYWLHPVQQEFHLKFLQSLFFGYSEMNAISFILGIIQSYIWGYIIAIIWYFSSYCAGGCCKRD